MKPSRTTSSWVLILPFPILFLGALLYRQAENEVRAQYERAQAQWRAGQYSRSIELYRNLTQEYPQSRYADDALWESATIYYVNLYDVDGALSHYRKLTQLYPKSPLAKRAYRKLAELYELEVDDLAEAVDCLRHALELEPRAEERSTLAFEMAGIYLKMDRYEEALGEFQRVGDNRHDRHLAQRALIRAGIVQQIQKDYRQSVHSFQQVLQETTCTDCRLQAQLELIESHEFLDQLSEAIEVARSIRESDYFADAKQQLLERLGDKRRYYRLHPWDGR